ncbi:MAG TPA: NAD(P)H-binding protein [Acidimicrobiales bacterium]
MEQVLIIGGTGTLGRRLTPVLVERGHGVRVLSRRSAQAVPTGVVSHRGDIRTGEGLAPALDGVETVIQAVAATRSAKATELEGMRTLLAARGNRHVLYVSIVGVDRNPFAYYRTKLEAERLLERSNGNWTIQRATQFHDLIDRFLGLPFFAKTPHLRFQPVATDDVSLRLADLVAAGPSGRAPDMGGPEILPIEELNRVRAMITGRCARLVPLPLVGVVKAFDQGVHLAPDHRVGTQTWEQWLVANRES